MQNNNEKWREELMMLLHRITAEYTEWKYAKYLFSPLDDFIAFQISQAEQRGKREGLEEAEEIIANYAEEESESAILKRIRKKFNQKNEL